MHYFVHFVGIPTHINLFLRSFTEDYVYQRSYISNCHLLIIVHVTLQNGLGVYCCHAKQQ